MRATSASLGTGARGTSATATNGRTMKPDTIVLTSSSSPTRRRAAGGMPTSSSVSRRAASAGVRSRGSTTPPGSEICPGCEGRLSLRLVSRRWASPSRSKSTSSTAARRPGPGSSTGRRSRSAAASAAARPAAGGTRAGGGGDESAPPVTGPSLRPPGGRPARAEAAYPDRVSAPAPIPLSPEDRAILDLEGETVAGHACKVVLLEGPAPGVEDLRREVAGRIAGAPELTRRLAEVGGAPAWVAAEGFDVADHVVASPAGPPFDAAGLRREVARLFAERLDRARPLWRIDVVPLADGGRALVWRTHHALADGTAAMRLADAVLWDARPAPEGARASAAAADRERRRRLRGVLHREFGPPGHRSPFDGRIGTRREVAFGTIPLRPLHDAARAACGGTVNDAVLSSVGGGIRRWLEARGGRLGTLRVRVPVSLHHQGDDAGNRDSFFSVGIPLDEPDAVARLQAVSAATAARKAAGDAETLDRVSRELARAAPALEALVERLEASPRAFAVAVSNVMGPRTAVSVLGARVTRLYSLAEIGPRHALRVGAVSLGESLSLGLCADPDLVDDVQAIAEGAEAEAHALIAAA